MKLVLNDKTIERLKIQDLEFSYQDKQGIIKHKDRIYIPFNVAKKSLLKGLTICIHRSTGNKTFNIRFWFKKKSKNLPLGKFVLGIYGIKQVEDKLFSIVKDHTNEKGVWIKDPVITERDKTRVITAVKDSYFGHYSSKLKIFV